MLVLGLLALITVLLILRQPVLVILLASLCYCYFFWSDSDLRFLVLDSWDALNREVLLSIPLYLLAGTLMSRGSIARRITDLLRELTVFIPGGLALSALLACGVFGAMSGSSTVTLMAVGSVLYPALLEAGYDKKLAIGLLCAAGTLGIIIPPSIPLILYGVMAQVSIVDLFIAGIGPALLLSALMAVYVLFACRHMPTSGFTAQLLPALKRSVWALLAPAIILGGIYSGFFTATEAAVVAVFYTLIVQVFFYREMGFGDVITAIEDTSALIGSLFPVLMLATCLNMFLTFQELPVQLLGWLSGMIDSQVVFLVLTNLLLLLVGSIVDIGSAILILAPLLKPLASTVGIDSVHLGVMMIVNLEIGYLTPPLGLNLIIAMGVFKEEFWTICKAVVPFVLLMLVGLFIVAWLPQITLFLI